MTCHLHIGLRLGRRRLAGNTLIEFALVSVFLVPLMLGTVNVGLSLGRSIQTTQVCRDAGHMFVRQVDFSQTGNQDILVRLAEGLNMSRNGGDGVIILTKTMFIGATECAAGGLQTSQCPNFSKAVVTQRLVIGNASLRTSSIAQPASSIIAAGGVVAVADYLTNLTARANGLPSGLNLQPSELAYVSESFFAAPAWNFPGSFESGGTYARTIF